MPFFLESHAKCKVAPWHTVTIETGGYVPKQKRPCSIQIIEHLEGLHRVQLQGRELHRRQTSRELHGVIVAIQSDKMGVSKFKTWGSAGPF